MKTVLTLIALIGLGGCASDRSTISAPETTIKSRTISMTSPPPPNNDYRGGVLVITAPEE